MNIFQAFASFVVGLAALVGIAAPSTVQTPVAQQPQSVERGIPLGATIPKVVAKFETALASGIADTDTSMTLVSGTDGDGNALSGYTCFTLNEGKNNEEFVCGTASSTSVTGMLRGLSVIDGDLEVSDRKFDHRRGESVKVTDHPSLSIALRILNGDETLENILRYSAPKSFSATASSSLVDKNYVDNLSIAGVPDASTSTKGIVEIGTSAELYNGTSTPNTTAPTVPQISSFNGTSSANVVPVAKSNGKLSQGFLDLTEDFAWSGTHTFSGTVALNGTTSGVLVGQGFFGDGSDGAATISASTTLTRDMYYTNLTVTSSAVLNPGGYRIFIRDLLTVGASASIARNGSNSGAAASGTDASGSTGGNGGAGGTGVTALASGNIYGALGGVSGQGGKGGSGLTPGTAGSPTGVSNGTSSINIISSSSVAGVAGGGSGGGGSADAAGTAGSGTFTSTFPRNYHTAVGMTPLATTSLFQSSASNGGSSGGAGGAQGSGGNDEPGGGGGGAGGTGGNGGLIAIYARQIVNLGTISALGGVGGIGGNGGKGVCTDGNAGGSGGGGAGGTGGNGGAIVLVYDSLTNSGTISVAGGAGGTGGTSPNAVVNNGCGNIRQGSSGATGNTGSTGVIYYVEL